jgi:hypothetical protein
MNQLPSKHKFELPSGPTFAPADKSYENCQLLEALLHNPAPTDPAHSTYVLSLIWKRLLQAAYKEDQKQPNFVASVIRLADKVEAEHRARRQLVAIKACFAHGPAYDYETQSELPLDDDVYILYSAIVESFKKLRDLPFHRRGSLFNDCIFALALLDLLCDMSPEAASEGNDRRHHYVALSMLRVVNDIASSMHPETLNMVQRVLDVEHRNTKRYTCLPPEWQTRLKITLIPQMCLGIDEDGQHYPEAATSAEYRSTTRNIEHDSVPGAQAEQNESFDNKRRVMGGGIRMQANCNNSHAPTEGPQGTKRPADDDLTSRLKRFKM